MAEIHPAVVGEPDLDDRREPLAPRHLVRVVLVGPDEHDRLPRPQRRLEVLDGLVAEVLAEHTTNAPPGGRRERDPKNLLELVDGPRRAGAAGDEPPVRPRVHGLLDERLGLVEQLRRAAARRVVLSVAVGVEASEVSEVILHEAEAAAGSGEVGVDEGSLAEGRREQRVHAERLLAEGGEIERNRGHGQATS